MEFSIFGKCLYASKAIIVIVIAALLVATVAIGWYAANKGDDIIVVADDKANAGKTGEKGGGAVNPGKEGNTEQEGNQGNTQDSGQGIYQDEKKEQTEYIMVCIVGCVQKPGIVKLKKGSIIEDAVKAAGGFTDEADLENINRVYVLNDNTWIKIKSSAEAKASEPDGKSTKGGSGTAAGGSASKPNSASSGQSSTAESGNNGAKAGSGVEISNDSKGVVESEGKNSAPNDQAEPVTTLVNINSATVSQLEMLPGIGPKTAEAIIEYRTSKGRFAKKEDLMNVKGIGEKKFAKIKDLITVN